MEEKLTNDDLQAIEQSLEDVKQNHTVKDEDIDWNKIGKDS